MSARLTESQILAAVDSESHTNREIHARVGMWSVTTVRHVLNGLAKRGIIEKEASPFGEAKYRLHIKGRGNPAAYGEAHNDQDQNEQQG
jgi:predicted transcriptional regulator